MHSSVMESCEEFKHPSCPQEVADLMGQFYELLAKMGYFEPSAIAYPPHMNPTINRASAEALGHSQKAIEMMEMLPYLRTESENIFHWFHGAADYEFLLSGIFVDYRQNEYLHDRDPLYGLEYTEGADKHPKDFDENGGQYMKPGYILLSNLGNHGSMMVLNTDNYKLWTINSESDDTEDFALKDVEVTKVNNYLSLDNYPSRPARLALRDYIQKLIDLEWMPGGLCNDTWAGDEYARLYIENGWPENFNREAFMTARLQWEEAEIQRWDAEEPFAEVKKYEQWFTNCLRQIEWKENQIAEVDDGKELPDGQSDPGKYRQELLDEITLQMENLPKQQEDLEAARKVLTTIDPQARKVREDRIAKYGY